MARSVCEAKTATYVAMVASRIVGRSSVYNRYRVGPKTLPFETPDGIGHSSHIVELEIGGYEGRICKLGSS